MVGFLLIYFPLFSFYFFLCAGRRGETDRREFLRSIHIMDASNTIFLITLHTSVPYALSIKIV